MYEFAVTPAVTSIRRRGVGISDVAPGSLGAEMDLEPGDRIIKVNGRTVRDYLDFRFQTAGETELLLEVRKKSGDDWELDDCGRVRSNQWPTDGHTDGERVRTGSGTDGQPSRSGDRAGGRAAAWCGRGRSRPDRRHARDVHQHQDRKSVV